MSKRVFLGAAITLMAAPSLFAADFFTYTGTPVHEGPQFTLVTTNEFLTPGARVRIGSYNIENFTDGIDDEPTRTPDVAARHAKMASALLDRMDADILVVQEIENGKMLGLLNDDLAKPYAIGYLTQYGAGTKDVGKMNEGVLSRFKIESPTELDFGPLTGPGRPTRGLFRFEVDMGEQHRLLIYVMHLKSNFGNMPRNIAQRKAALQILRDDAENIRASDTNITWEIIALGDTNVDPDLPQFARDPSLNPLKGWVDLWRNVPAEDRVTIPTRHGDPSLEFDPAAFDRFFVSPELTNSPWTAGLPVSIKEGCSPDVAVLPGQGDHISDHYPVYLDLAK